ncbi:MAG: glucose-6-phosphate isomerase [Desulfarculaceae bacterium]|nr:glucose-6-phosphate isomerase [Desulfarculaceae bacterium]MCF8071761.1 glucose-6-phosphate isomerase [Desulfarculaceae bacterium]MCF8101311.1 glucose-6-phosphate isomerase [Desulfarculaceae bacterium]MCF8117270.1 glucose-6-phosphate isomerase [Desulfarculaceae bacterium]
MAKRGVKLDYAYCRDEIIGPRGVTSAQLKELAPAVEAVHLRINEQHAAGELGFMDLPGQDEVLDQVLEQAARMRSIADELVVLGIGGSALGTTAVDMALKGAMRHALPPGPDGMRVFVADNSDPRFFGAVLDQVDLERTAFCVISKSGSTAETMSQFLIVKELLERRLDKEEALRRLVFITDPQKGNLRLIAEDEPVAILNVPPNVGGRYSVLSPVGLLPLACAGHDVSALLAGAAAMAADCTSPDLMKNPAYLIAALNVSFYRQGRNILVMMPYATDLFGLAQWFAQLWAESLGKADSLSGEKVHVGQTPAAAVGATDQHSQLQLYMEGPEDKLVMFLTLDNYGRDLVIPELYPKIDALSYLGGRSLAELVHAESRATAAALASEGRPSYSLRLPAVSPETLGEVIYMLELATVMAGGLLDINPLDQPGVELSKQLSYGLMGRKGFEEQAERMKALDAGDEFLV